MSAVIHHQSTKNEKHEKRKIKVKPPRGKPWGFLAKESKFRAFMISFL